MRRVPEDFAERLHDTFDGRLRIRWSLKKRCWSIEQQIGRRRSLSRPVTDLDDGLIMARDGYMPLMDVQPGDRMPCPTCGATLKVPVFEYGAVNCDFCERHGNVYQYAGAFFELNDRLIDYLKMLDPLRGASRRLRNRVDDHNRRLSASLERGVLTQAEAAVSDDFNRIAGIPFFGYR